MLFDSFITLVLFSVLVFTLLKLLQRPTHEHRLPGPPGLPFIGHILFLTKQPWRKFLQWKMEYGPILGISVFGKQIVVVSDSTILMEAYSRPDALGTFHLEYYKMMTVCRGGAGFLFSEGKAWQEYRTFFLKSFNDFGTRGRKITHGISSESRKLVSDLNKCEGAPINIEYLFQQYALNAIWQAIANETFTPEGVHLNLTAMKAMVTFDSTLDYMGLLFPRIFDKFTSVLDWRFEAFRKLRTFSSAIIEQHLSTRVPGEPRDMIDKLQDVVEGKNDPESHFHAKKNSIVPLMTDVSNAAVDTSSITLQWLILYCLKYPDIQAKIQAEITKVIGQDREPVYDDQANMPFTEACILEALRSQTTIPYALPRHVLKNFMIQDKIIPEGAILVPNLIGMNHDPSVWEDPDLFRPERFLTPEDTISPDMKKKIRSFNVGKHQCPGERFARETLFMMFTNLVQNFHLSTSETISFDVTMGFMSRPSQPISVSFKPRRKN